MRDLLTMFEAASRHRWNHTSHMLAAIHNSAYGRKGKALTPDQFNPHVVKRRLTTAESRALLDSAVSNGKH